LVMTRKPRGEAHVDTLLAKVVMKGTAECGEEIDAKLAAVIETCAEPTGRCRIWRGAASHRTGPESAKRN